MDKRDWIIKALSMLEDVWPDAKLLKRGVEEGIFDDEKIEILIDRLQDAIKDVKDVGVREKMEKGLSFIKKVNEMEEAERKKEESELEDLESMMENI